MASMRPSNSLRRAMAIATDGVASVRTPVTMSSRCSA
jgi:hypothetical protein